MKGGVNSMPLIRWNPWNLSSFFDEDWDFPTVPGISRMMGQGLNIYETDKNIVAEVALPGIPEEKVDLSIDDGVVRISASDEKREEDKGNRKYFMSSMAQTYNYAFRLPEGISEDQEPGAVLHNGVLTLTFKKVEQVAPKKIKVISKGGSEKAIATNSKVSTQPATA